MRGWRGALEDVQQEGDPKSQRRLDLCERPQLHVSRVPLLVSDEHLGSYRFLVQDAAPVVVGFDDFIYCMKAAATKTHAHTTIMKVGPKINQNKANTIKKKQITQPILNSFTAPVSWSKRLPFSLFWALVLLASQNLLRT